MKQIYYLIPSFIVFVGGIVLIILLLFGFLRRESGDSAGQTLNLSPDRPVQVGSTPVFTEVRTSSFLQSDPENNALFATSPTTVSVTFNEVLAPSSSIAVTTSDGIPAHLGRVTISNDRLTMTVLLRKNMTGPLTVTYHACDVFNVCETGGFGFVVKAL